MPTELSVSSVVNVVLTLLLLFQWLKQHAKEQSVKNTLFSVRRILNSVSGSEAAVATLDAALATLGARNPFIKRFCGVRDMIAQRFKKQESAPVEQLQNEKETRNNRKTKQ